MKTRMRVTVLAVALTLVVVSDARPFVVGVVALVVDLPVSAVVLGLTSCFLLLLSLLLLCRTWVVRKGLVLVLARFGTPNPAIARSVNMPQDGVAFIRCRSGGKHGSFDRHYFPAEISDPSIQDHPASSIISS